MNSYSKTIAAFEPTDWAVICDFDGTIATCDVTDSVLAAFALPEWERIEAAWKAGKIGSRECMARQVALLRVAPEELDRHIDGLDIDPNFAEFAAFCVAENIPLAVVSDGLDYAIRRMFERHGLSDIQIHANRLEHVAGDRFRLGFPNFNPRCRVASGICKCQTARWSAGHRPVILIGDGASDFCLAGEADLVFAKDKLLRHCRREGLTHVAFLDFSDVTRLLADLICNPTGERVANA